jgi:hypothetical protein
VLALALLALNDCMRISPDKIGQSSMDTLRFFGLAAFMFAAVFLGVSWLFRVEPLKPSARIPTFHQVDKDDPLQKLAQTSVSDEDPTRDRLRHDVLDNAKALSDDPCNSQLKRWYIKAVVAYARAWISIAPCVATRTCGSGDSQKLDRAEQAFGSPLDVRVRDAMTHLHAKGIFGPADFPKDTARLVAELAADGSINSAADTKEFRHMEARLGGGDAPTSRQDCGH